MKKIIAMLSVAMLVLGSGAADAATKQPKPRLVSSWSDYGTYGLYKQCVSHRILFVWLGTAGIAMTMSDLKC